MDWKFVLALVFALIVAVFALQNAGTVDISFLNLDLTISQALVILISAVIGALVVMMLSLVRWIRYQGKLKSGEKMIAALEQENGKLKMQLETIQKKEVPQAEPNSEEKQQI